MKNDASTLIDNYLLHKLTETEAREVEMRAATEPEFAKELQLQKDILKGIELYGDEKIKTKIAALDHVLAASGFFNPPPSPVHRPPSTVHRLPSPVSRWAAAAIVLLLCAGLWWMFKTTPVTTNPEATNTAPATQTQPEILPTPNPAPPVAQTLDTDQEKKQISPLQPDSKRLALARSNWSAPDFSNIRAAVQSSPTLGTRAAEAFQQKKYDTVIQLLEAIQPKDANYWPLSELLAHAYFLSGKTELAKRRFNNIAISGQLPYSERAEWFLLLCHLANFPQEKAQFDVLLKKIRADEGHPYYEAAQKLAAQLSTQNK